MQGAAGAISMHIDTSNHLSQGEDIFNAVSSPDGYTLGLPLMESGGH